MNNGFVKFYRQLAESPAWMQSTPTTKSVLIALMFMVNYEEKKWFWNGRLITIRPGQVVTTLDAIAEKSGRGVTAKCVRSALDRLQKTGFLTNESTNRGRLITFLNYDNFRDSETGADKPGVRQGASGGHAPVMPGAATKENKKERIKETKKTSGEAGFDSEKIREYENRLLAVCRRLATGAGAQPPAFANVHEFADAMLRKRMRIEAVTDVLEHVADNPGIRNPWAWAEKVVLIKSQNLNEAEAIASHRALKREPAQWPLEPPA